MSKGLSAHHPTGNLNNTDGGKISNTKCLAKDGNDDLSTFDKLLLSQGSVRIHIYLGKYIPAKTNPSTGRSRQKKLCINLGPSISLAALQKEKYSLEIQGRQQGKDSLVLFGWKESFCNHEMF